MELEIVNCRKTLILVTIKSVYLETLNNISKTI